MLQDVTMKNGLCKMGALGVGECIRKRSDADGVDRNQRQTRGISMRKAR